MSYKIGAIASIKLENFVTYGEVALRPGPHLNMIMGPNGTGKSTLVCAIVIGLGGSLSVIGRATNLNAYIRQGKLNASVQIELVNNPSNVIITRTFGINGKSQFKINGQPKSAKDVQELCKKFNIQVDNLCQFLPQDRVQDFSKLNAQDLLLSTQRSVTNSETAGTHQELIALRQEHRLLTQETEKIDQQLQTAQRANERLHTIVQNIEKQKELKEELKTATVRLHWLYYEQSREEFEGIKNDRKLAQNEVNKFTKQIEPLEKACNQIKKKVTEKNTHLSTMRRFLQSQVTEMQDMHEALEKIDENIASHKNGLLTKYKQSRGKEQEINVLENLMTTTKVRLVETLGEYKTRENLGKKISSLSGEVSAFAQKMNDFESKRSAIVTDLNNSVNAEIRLCKHNLAEIQNVAARRLDILRQLNEDAYKATIWLKDNQQMFRAKVYSPMIIELNMKNPEHAKYLENTVSNRDLVAFTCETTEDVNLLIKKLKTEMRLKINVVHSSPGNLTSYIPKYSIDSIRQFGFFSYLLGLVEGPEPILSYLCKSYQIHRIPIGTSETNRLTDKIPADFSLFFSDKFRYNIKVSNYTGEKSTATVQISDGNLLNHNIDLSAQEKIQKRLQQLIKSSDDLKNNISIIETSMKQLQEQKSRAMDEKRQIQEKQNQLDNLLHQLKRHKVQMDSLKSEYFDLESEQSAFRQTIKDAIDSMLKIHKDIFDKFNNLKNKIKEHVVDTCLVEQLMELVRVKECDMADLKDRLQNSEKQLRNVSSAYDRVKIEAKSKYDEALALSDNLAPDNPNFPNKSKFESLPTTIEDLNDLLTDCQSRLNCLNVGDGNTYEDYMQRKNLIDSLSKNAKNGAMRSANLIELIQNKGKAWREEVETLVAKIRDNFGRYMGYLDCAGDVSLICGGTEEDYDKYGISIKVRYRGDESLQELNRYTQSGGERAVATAIYLLALQELTNVPFRCVDEINQGMDPVNERRVFELLVKATSEHNNTAQYFLLTPKLLPDLTYAENVTVNIINNGQITVPNDWSRNLVNEILAS